MPYLTLRLSRSGFVLAAIACRTETITPADASSDVTSVQGFSSVAFEDAPVFSHVLAPYELALRDSVISAVPNDARAVIADLLSKRHKNIVLGLSVPDTALLGLFQRLTQAQISGNAPPSIAGNYAIKITLVLPISAPRARSQLLRQPGAIREDIIVLSTQDATGQRVSALIEAFKARQSATAERPTVAEAVELDGDDHLHKVFGARIERGAHLLQQLKSAPVLDVPGVGSAHALDITIPTHALEAQTKKSR
jgi:hypothetical protein